LSYERITPHPNDDAILIQPILFEPDKDIIITLERTLLEQFNTSSIVMTSPIKQVPDGLFNEQRNTLEELPLYYYKATYGLVVVLLLFLFLNLMYFIVFSTIIKG
jgi:hypothetical protein